MDISLKFLSIFFEFRVLQIPHKAWYQWSIGEESSCQHHRQLLGICWRGLRLGLEWDSHSCPFTLLHGSSQVRRHSFSLRKLECPLLAKATLQSLPYSSDFCEGIVRHSEYLVTTREKWCYYLDSWCRQSLQNHFINHILKTVRKYLLQTTITIVSFGKWILNFRLVHQKLFPKCNVCFCFFI